MMQDFPENIKLLRGKLQKPIGKFEEAALFLMVTEFTLASIFLWK